MGGAILRGLVCWGLLWASGAIVGWSLEAITYELCPDVPDMLGVRSVTGKQKG
jgi:hypothetical protein